MFPIKNVSALGKYCPNVVLTVREFRRGEAKFPECPFS